ncbi:MAG TPA: hypothetical protein VJS39_06175 [Gemmatimonadaceae bacterium]|nr:hypothetical protein [Gemmatimonadaceae bacterium]
MPSESGSMPRRIRSNLVMMLLVLLLIPVLALVRELARRSDIWWTPKPLAVSLSESAKRVEVIVRGRSLRPLVDEGHISLTTDSAAPVVGAGDITFRFNNWDRVRAQKIPVLLVYALMIGVIGTLLVVVLTGKLAYRDDASAPRG